MIVFIFFKILFRCGVIFLKKVLNSVKLYLLQIFVFAYLPVRLKMNVYHRHMCALSIY